MAKQWKEWPPVTFVRELDAESTARFRKNAQETRGLKFARPIFEAELLAMLVDYHARHLNVSEYRVPTGVFLSSDIVEAGYYTIIVMFAERTRELRVWFVPAGAA